MISEPLFFSVGDHVTYIGKIHPIGVVEEVKEYMVTVLWGVADKREFREHIRQELLQLINFNY